VEICLTAASERRASSGLLPADCHYVKDSLRAASRAFLKQLDTEESRTGGGVFRPECIAPSKARVLPR